jgi:CheY-like chemotaxis protein
MARKILVVEDDQPILELMELLIKKIGHEPVLVTNGVEALELVKREAPDLILLDIMMMPMSGWEFLDRLRNEQGIRDLPVLLFTAVPSIEEKVAKLQDKNLGIIHKPVSFIELKEEIGKYLG